MTSPQEQANRTAKALRLVAFLDAHLAIVDLDVVAELGDTEWQRIAELAGERTPSTATRAAVGAVLAGRKISPEPVDVFAGLSS